ncbi:MAG TPA: hypothetical protein VJR25_14045 [Microbacterium sp.]|jgi:hypothetical protein|uniref:hypothetical protein n=1 Tax=Microbacterium sp. TaxID=51671 RepID=UPI002B45E169|nr:hypothetical protein [Microbacterium sp.]HKT57881.1 hypothetical protein [Microbacterium sp.]
MPRARRPRPQPDGDALERMILGWKRTEVRGGVEWYVQPMPASRSEKAYTCPGCGRQIAPGAAHLVAWRADGIMGDAADLAARRHWHTACWKVS